MKPNAALRIVGLRFAQPNLLAESFTAIKRELAEFVMTKQTRHEQAERTALTSE
jgi:hypothetical protein